MHASAFQRHPLALVIQGHARTRGVFIPEGGGGSETVATFPKAGQKEDDLDLRLVVCLVAHTSQTKPLTLFWEEASNP